ncbi:MAG: hypothetical protein Q4B10_07480 [Actinomycetaceae bacterium]|nr:hypothetical protein [Actinomycetaceae bacterium]
MNESHSSAQALFATRVHMLLAADLDWGTRRAFTIARERYGLDELALALHVSPRELAAFCAPGAPAAPGDVQRRLLEFVGDPVDPAELSENGEAREEAAAIGVEDAGESSADEPALPEADTGREDARVASPQRRADADDEVLAREAERAGEPGVPDAQAQLSLPDPAAAPECVEVDTHDVPDSSGQVGTAGASEAANWDPTKTTAHEPDGDRELPPAPPVETALAPREAGESARARVLYDAAHRYATALQRRERWWRVFFVAMIATLACAAVLVWFIDDARAIAFLATACAISAAASTIVAARERAGDVDALRLLVAALDDAPADEPR